jgi:hypothetical protein
LLAGAFITTELAKAHDDITDVFRFDIAIEDALPRGKEKVVIVGWYIQGALVVEASTTGNAGITEKETHEPGLLICVAEADA